MTVKKINNNSYELTIDKSLYSEDVIHKCFYWYGGKMGVSIEKESEMFRITLSDSTGNLSIDTVVANIKRDLLDFKTREIIARETKDIRAILIAKAFANEDTFDEDPSRTIRDPLGLDPSEF